MWEDKPLDFNSTFGGSNYSQVPGIMLCLIHNQSHGPPQPQPREGFSGNQGRAEKGLETSRCHVGSHKCFMSVFSIIN